MSLVEFVEFLSPKLLCSVPVSGCRWRECEKCMWTEGSVKSTLPATESKPPPQKKILEKLGKEMEF